MLIAPRHRPGTDRHSTASTPMSLHTKVLHDMFLPCLRWCNSRAHFVCLQLNYLAVPEKAPDELCLHFTTPCTTPIPHGVL
jgi:hypothetical protein